jgi:hypothetical protein
LVPKQFPNVATRSQTFPSISKTIPNSFPNGSQSLLKCGSHLSHAVFASVCAIDWQCVFYKPDNSAATEHKERKRGEAKARALDFRVLYDLLWPCLVRFSQKDVFRAALADGKKYMARRRIPDRGLIDG